MKRGFIYKYTFPNGKVYIGQTRVSVRDRHYQHMSAANDPDRRTICEVAIKKYGEPKIEIIETIEVEDSEVTKLIGLLDEAEKKWIEKYDSTNREKGYNITHGGQRITPEQFILQEKWYELFEKERWGEMVGYFRYVLFERIKTKVLSNEKLDKEEMSIWYGYKFMDYSIGKETTFSGFYKRNQDGFLCDIGDLPYEVLEALDESKANTPEYEKAKRIQDSIFFDNIINDAIDENWVKDIRQTIWREVMKNKEKVIKEWYVKQ